jgi:hypothetical protein
VYWSTASLLRLASPFLAAIAVAGYLAGHHHASTASAGTAGSGTRIAYGANVLLEYPPGWRTAAGAAPAIPGLSIAHPMLLAPAGDGTRSGLLSGQIPAESPLPAALLATLSGAPHTEVVDLLDAQAYRYSQLSPRGYHGALELYVIPTVTSSQTVLACYAASALSSPMRQCEQIVAGLTLTGGSPTDLTPEAGYAAHLAQLVGALDAQRLALRREMSQRTTSRNLARLAATLANDFGNAASSLAALEPPRTAGTTHMSLTRSILGARRAYDALAGAALAGRPARYAAAQTRVANAEASVDAALESFTLLGYTRPS